MKIQGHKALLIIVLLFGIIQSIKGQDDHKMDSLKHLLKVYNDEEKLMVVNEQLFEHYKLLNARTALPFAESYEKLALRSGDSLRIIKGGRMRVYCLLDLDGYVNSVKILTRILDVAVRNQNNPEIKKNIKFILNNLGLAYQYLGKYDKSLEYHFRSLKIRKEEGDPNLLSSCYNNIGLVYYNIFEYDEAIKYLKLSLVVNSKKYEPYQNIALALIGKKNFKEAKKFANAGMAMCDGNCSDYVLKNAYQTLGVACTENKEFDEAEKYIRKSLYYAIKVDDERFIVEDSTNLGRIAMERGQTDEAIHIYKRMYIKATRGQYAVSKIYTSARLSALYFKKNDHVNAAKFREIYRSIKDSTYNARMINHFVSLEKQYSDKKVPEKIPDQPFFVFNRNVQIFLIVISSLGLVAASVLIFSLTRKTLAEIDRLKNSLEGTDIISYDRQVLNILPGEPLSSDDVHITPDKLRAISSRFLDLQGTQEFLNPDQWEATSKYLESKLKDIEAHHLSSSPDQKNEDDEANHPNQGLKQG